MKNIFLSLILCSSIGLLFAQETQRNYGSVMIIPFDPNMYFSDADDQLAKYNEKSIKEVRTMFRYGLNVNLTARILSEYNTRPILTDTAKGAQHDLYAIYKSIGYYADKSMPMESTFDKEEKKPIFSGRNKSREREGLLNSKVQKEESREYINVRIKDVEMLKYLQKKYGTDLFVFINQFNLVTDFEHCLDRATNTYERDVKVHFSIYDYNGKQLAGDVVTVRYASNSNDLVDIMKENFPVVSDYLANTMPKKIKSPEELKAEEPLNLEDLQEIEYNYQEP